MSCSERRSYAEVASDAVEAIVRDLRDRSGLENAWDDIDFGIQDEIREEWKKLVLQAMGSRSVSGPRLLLDEKESL